MSNQQNISTIVVESVKALLIFSNSLIIIISLMIALIIGLMRAKLFDWQSRDDKLFIIISVILILLYCVNHFIAIYAIFNYLINYLIVTTSITTIIIIIFIFILTTNLFLLLLLNVILSIVYYILIMNNLHIVIDSVKNSVHFSGFHQNCF